ncbi:MAG: tetratricopeptide repeat protein [Pseudomonadota bacterium]
MENKGRTKFESQRTTREETATIGKGKMMLIGFLIFSAFSFFNAVADDFGNAKVDFYRGANEFAAEVDSIITSKQDLKRMQLDEQFEGKVENVEALEEANRKIGIKSFEKYIEQYPESDYVPDILYRLGKLYFEESSQKLIKETDTYEREYRKFLRGEVQVLPPEPGVDYSQATRMLNRLNTNYKNYRFRDDSLYLLGYCYFEEGRVEKAMGVFNDLIKEYPKSSKLAEVYTRVGEHYFDVDEFKKATYYYTHVLEYPDTIYYDNVLYKLAWVYYRDGKVIEAAEYFTILIDHNEKKHGADIKSSIKNEAKNYIAIGFADHKSGIRGAYSFFRRLGGRSYEYEVMRKICELYLLSDRIKEAIDAIDFIMQKYPYEPENPVLQDKLISSFRRDENIKVVNKERNKMVSLFGESSKWRQNNKGNTAAIVVADHLIEKQLLSVALYHQEKGDRTKDRKEYIKAAQLYYDYLRKHQTDQFLVGARYNYAQILFNLRDYTGAIKEYTAVREYSEDMQFKEKGSFGVISSMQNKLKLSDPKYLLKEIRPVLDASGIPLKAQELTPDEKALVSACSEYEFLKLRNRRTPYVMYVEAEVYFRNNKLDDAKKKYLQIIESFPEDKIVLDATRNMIAAYNYERDYSKVEEWSKKLLASQKLTGASEVQGVKSLITGSVFRKARQMEDNGQLDAAASEYTRLAKQYPRSTYSDAALYNSGLIYEKINKPIPATNSYRLMLTRYPNSKHSRDATFRAAVNSEQMLDFNGAIYFYDQIIKKYPKTQISVDANYNVARLKRGVGNYTGAADNLMSYQSNISNEKERSSTIMQVAWLYDKGGQKQRSINAYGMYIESGSTDLDGIMQAYIMRAHLYEETGKPSVAYAEYKKAAEIFLTSKGAPNTLAYAYNAEAVFKLTQEQFERYKVIKIQSGDNQKTMKAVYDEKEKTLKNISEQYLKIVELGSPEWSIASLFMIGNAYQKFADFLYEAPMPKELNTEELQSEYRSQLQGQAMPYEDKAMEYYERTISESSRLKVVNDWTKQARGKMAKMKPDQYYDYRQTLLLSYPSVDIKDGGFMGQ